MKNQNNRSRNVDGKAGRIRIRRCRDCGVGESFQPVRNARESDVTILVREVLEESQAAGLRYVVSNPINNPRLVRAYLAVPGTRVFDSVGSELDLDRWKPDGIDLDQLDLTCGTRYTGPEVGMWYVTFPADEPAGLPYKYALVNEAGWLLELADNAPPPGRGGEVFQWMIPDIPEDWGWLKFLGEGSYLILSESVKPRGVK